MNTSLGCHQSPSILVIESDPEGRSLLRATLSAEDYLLNEATTANTGLKQVEALRPDAILINPALPDMNGVDVIRKARLLGRLLPIIVLSGKTDELSKVSALDAGADDFIEKPFIAGELLARLRAALRRTTPVAEETDASLFQARGLTVDFSRREVRVNGSAVHLTPIEFKLLRMFTRYPNRILTHAILIKEVWGSEGDQGSMCSLRVYIRHLRRKLCSDSDTWCHLQTKAKIGYQLQTE